MKKHFKTILRFTIILLLFHGCADKYENQIDKHFKKFILTDELKDFKIEDIKTKKLTKSQNEINKINSEIKESKSDIVFYSNKIISIKNELLEIKNGKQWNYEGRPYYSYKNPIQIYGNTRYDSAKFELWDYDNLGRKKIIDTKNAIIQDMYSHIPLLENSIKINELKKDSINKNSDQSVLFVNSIVTIKGMRATGLSRRNLQVIQYPSGDIKSVKVL